MSENRREQEPAPESNFVSRAEFNDLKDRFDTLEQMFQEVKTERDNIVKAIAEAAVNNFDAASRARLLSVAGVDPQTISRARNAANQNSEDTAEQPTVVLRSRPNAPRQSSAEPFSAPARGTASRGHFTQEEADRAQAIADARSRISAESNTAPSTNSQAANRRPSAPRTPRTPNGPRSPRDGNTSEYQALNDKRSFRNRMIGAFAIGAALAATGWALFSGGASKDSQADTNSNARPNTPTLTANANAAANLTPQQKSAIMDKISGSMSIGEATKAINSNESNIKQNIAAIFASNEHIQLNHNNGAMSSVLNEYGPGQIDAVNGAEVVALSVESSDSYAAGLYNAMNGRHVQDPLPQGVTPEQAREFIKQVMISPGTKFSIQRPTGAFENHGMRGENRFNAGTFHANGNVTMFVITDAHGNNTYIKTSNECFNVLNKFVGRHIKTSFGVIHVPAPTPSNPHPKPIFHPRPKHDPNHTPAGVPGEPRGSGGNGPEATRPQAGNAPSGVGQTQAPTPSYIPNSGQSTAPAETGVDHGTNGPATPGNGTSNPAGQINSGSTPSGE